MHEKEFRKTKNGTGRMTHLSLPNSYLFVGIDFTDHKRLNALLDDPNYEPFILYPSDQALNLSTHKLSMPEGKNPLFILIDSTWACSKKMIKLSSNLSSLPKVSFTTTQTSNFAIKEQPKAYCLSTIETTHKILELLSQQNIENFPQENLAKLLQPFTSMINYQLQAANDANVRYKAPTKR